MVVLPFVPVTPTTVIDRDGMAEERIGELRHGRAGVVDDQLGDGQSQLVVDEEGGRPGVDRGGRQVVTVDVHAAHAAEQRAAIDAARVVADRSDVHGRRTDHANLQLGRSAHELFERHAVTRSSWHSTALAGLGGASPAVRGRWHVELTQRLLGHVGE